MYNKMEARSIQNYIESILNYERLHISLSNVIKC